jgi:plasmid replication initiation protein
MDVQLQKEKKSDQIKKHVAAIHCANNLSLLQRKVSNALLYNAYNQLLTHDSHEVSIAYLCKLIGYQGNNYLKIKEAIRALVSTLIEWNLIDDCGDEDWTACTMLAGARIKSGKCSYSYYSGLRTLLHSPSIYGRINLVVQSRFTSNYGLALYENCARYSGLKTTKDFSMTVFRRLMGVPEDRYPIFRDFKRRVLDIAVREVNTHSDILIEPHIKRIGRNVISIQFSIENREKRKRINMTPKPINNLMEPEPTVYVCLLKEFGVGEKDAREVIKNYGANLVEQKIQYVKNSPSFNSGRIKNLAAYLLKAIREDYQENVGSSEVIIKTNQLKEEEIENKKQEEEKNKKLIRAHSEYTTKEFLEGLAKISPEENAEMLSTFEKTLPSMFTNRYHKLGLKDALICLLFKSFVITNYAGKIPLTSLDDFKMRQ